MATKTNTVKVCGRRTNTGSPESWWVDTGIFVSPAASLRIEAKDPNSGIKPWPGTLSFTPAGQVGNTTNRDWDRNLAHRNAAGIETADAPICWFGSLIGRIGQDGKVFYVGDTPKIFTPTTSGTLYLAYNDGESFQDNEGYWFVDVTFEDTVLLPGYGPTSPAPYVYGSEKVFADRINTSLVDTWGVILTTQYNTVDTTAVWTTTAVNNLVSAFTDINARLQVYNRTFKQVFGGVELRFSQTLPAGPNGQIPAGQVFNENVVRFSNVTRQTTLNRNNDRNWGRTDSGYYSSTGSPYGFFIANNKGIQNTVIHELGHVLNYRTSQAMKNTGDSFALKVIKGVLAASPDAADDVGKFWENPSSDMVERVPDNFLNWVRNSYQGIANIDNYSSATTTETQRASAYWTGNTFNGHTSPGMSSFATSAKVIGDAASAPNSILRRFGKGVNDPTCSFF